MVGRASIIAVFAMFFLSALILRTITRQTTSQSDTMIRYNQRITGRNVAQSGVNLTLRQLVKNSLWRTGYSSLSVSGGKVSVSLQDVNFQRDAKSPLVAAIKITSAATVPFQTAVTNVSKRDTVFTTVAYIPRGFIPGQGAPGAIRGAVSTNNDITMGGTSNVDGRDHDTTGTLIPGNGVFGIWTTGTLDQKGASTIGGTNIRDVDFAPAKNPDTSVIRTGLAVTYPGTPDSVMGGAAAGYPEGRLKAIAQSGASGSQYVTNPGSLANRPFSGVTYVELPAAGQWKPADISGSGIIIVHNSTKNASMANVHGTFSGIIIADDVDHINSGTTIYGAVVGLSPLPALLNDLGNGHSDIFYSSIAIENATALVNPTVINTYSNKVISWWE